MHQLKADVEKQKLINVLNYHQVNRNEKKGKQKGFGVGKPIKAPGSNKGENAKKADQQRIKQGLGKIRLV